MSPDLLSLIVRAGAFVGLFQAAGAVVFLSIFEDRLAHSGPGVRRLGIAAALGAMALIAAHQLLEAARMADEYAGMVDAAMHKLAMFSSSGAAHAAQLLGLALLILGLRRSTRAGKVAASMGAMIVLLAFLLTGHTAVDARRWLLAPLLAAHLAIVAFWFGALAPLFMVVGRESREVAAWILQRFSVIAGWLVPGIAVAGLAMAVLLAPDLAVLRRPYGELLLVKLLGFGLLLGLAALNRWRWVPALADSQSGSRAAPRRSIAAEYLLIVAVLAVTATLTTFYSPDP